MLGKLESTVSFENFPINPEILELSSWIGKNAYSFIFRSGRAMNYNPEHLNLKFSLMKLELFWSVQLKTSCKKVDADSSNKEQEYWTPWTGSMWVNACVPLPGSSNHLKIREWFNWHESIVLCFGKLKS